MKGQNGGRFWLIDNNNPKKPAYFAMKQWV